MHTRVPHYFTALPQLRKEQAYNERSRPSYRGFEAVEQKIERETEPRRHVLFITAWPIASGVSLPRRAILSSKKKTSRQWMPAVALAEPEDHSQPGYKETQIRIHLPRRFPGKQFKTTRQSRQVNHHIGLRF